MYGHVLSLIKFEKYVNEVWTEIAGVIELLCQVSGQISAESYDPSGERFMPAHAFHNYTKCLFQLLQTLGGIVRR